MTNFDPGSYTSEQVAKAYEWYELYSRNPAVYPPGEGVDADGYVYADDREEALIEVALATENPDGFNPNQATLWQDGKGYYFKFSEQS